MPSSSDPDLWGPDVDVDPRAVEDDPEPDVDGDTERTCIDCDDPTEGDNALCWRCVRLREATRGDFEGP